MRENHENVIFLPSKNKAHISINDKIGKTTRLILRAVGVPLKAREIDFKIISLALIRVLKSSMSMNQIDDMSILKDLEKQIKSYPAIPIEPKGE